MQSSFKQYLAKRWNQIYTSPQNKLIWRGDIQKIKIKPIGSTYFAILNQSLKIKRVVIENKINTVFLNFEPKNFNFNKINKKQILFYLNFDNQELISNQDIIGNKKQNQQQADSVNHPVIVNISPLCRNHSLFSIFIQQQLPQIISADILQLVLNTFKLSSDLVIGFNSIGANSSVNHLHFHFLYREDLIKQKYLPIQRQKRKLIHKTSLVSPNQQIKSYQSGVMIEQLIGIAKGFILSPLNLTSSQISIYQSLCFVFGIIINELLQQNIAHNIIITESGNRIYIFPRLFQNGKNICAWVELGGILVYQDNVQYQKCNEETYNLTIKQVQVKESVFESIKKKVINSLKVYI